MEKEDIMELKQLLKQAEEIWQESKECKNQLNHMEAQL